VINSFLHLTAWGPDKWNDAEPFDVYVRRSLEEGDARNLSERFPRGRRWRITPVATPAHRSSVRGFGPEPVPLDQWSALLGSLLTIDSVAPVSSAGGIRGIGIHLLVSRAEDLEAGVYALDAQDAILIRRFDFRVDFFNEGIRGQEWLLDAPLLFALTVDFDRYVSIYGSRGLRFAMFEVGALAQHVAQIAQTVGLGSCTVGGFWDKSVNSELDFRSEDCMLLVAVGQPAE
jgi:SagB-type dehydrogenase family enzyme